MVKNIQKKLLTLQKLGVTNVPPTPYKSVGSDVSIWRVRPSFWQNLFTVIPPTLYILYSIPEKYLIQEVIYHQLGPASQSEPYDCIAVSE